MTRSCSRMVWQFANSGLVHVVDRVVKEHGYQNPIHYMLGCGGNLGADVPKNLRVHAPVTCLRCVVAPMNDHMIDGE